MYRKLWATGVSHWTMMMASSYNLVGITLERYLMIVHPIYHRTHMTKRWVITMCVIPWLVAVVYSYWSIFVSSGLVGTTCASYALWPNSRWFYASSTMDFLFVLIIPVGSMCCMYIRMVIALKLKVSPKPTAHGTTTQSSHNLSKAQRNLTKSCIIVVVVVYICLSSPSHTIWLMYYFGASVNLGSPLVNAFL